MYSWQRQLGGKMILSTATTGAHPWQRGNGDVPLETAKVRAAVHLGKQQTVCLRFRRLHIRIVVTGWRRERPRPRRTTWEPSS